MRKLSCISLLFALTLVLFGCGSSTKSQITDIGSLNYSQSKIGIPDDNSFDKIVIKRMSDAKLKYFTNSIDAVIAITSGKIDGYVLDRCNLDYMAAANDEVAVLPDSFGELDVCAATAKGNVELMAQFNEFIKGYQKDGTSEDMYNRWILKKGNKIEQIEKPKNPVKTLKVITNGVTEPMNFYQGSELVGYDIEFAQRFALAYNYEIEFLVMDYAAMPLAIASGKADCIISDFFYNEDRAKEIEYSDPYIKTQITLLVEKSRLAK